LSPGVNPIQKFFLELTNFNLKLNDLGLRPFIFDYCIVLILIEVILPPGVQEQIFVYRIDSRKEKLLPFIAKLFRFLFFFKTKWQDLYNLVS
jgi:hypothetical protein